MHLTPIKRILRSTHRMIHFCYFRRNGDFIPPPSVLRRAERFPHVDASISAND